MSQYLFLGGESSSEQASWRLVESQEDHDLKASDDPRVPKIACRCLEPAKRDEISIHERIITTGLKGHEQEVVIDIQEVAKVFGISTSESAALLKSSETFHEFGFHLASLHRTLSAASSPKVSTFFHAISDPDGAEKSAKGSIQDLSDQAGDSSQLTHSSSFPSFINDTLRPDLASTVMEDSFESPSPCTPNGPADSFHRSIKDVFQQAIKNFIQALTIEDSSFEARKRKHTFTILQTGNRFRHLETVQLLGQGSFGSVWAISPQTNKNRLEALKMSLSLEADESIRREYELLKTLNVENKVVGVQLAPRKVVVNLQTQRYGYLAHKYMGSLADKKYKFQNPFANSAIFQLFSGLAAVHSKQYIHGDIKPENVFYDDKRVDLADFGEAQSLMTIQQTLDQHKAPSEIAEELWGVCTPAYCHLPGDIEELEKLIKKYQNSTLEEQEGNLKAIFQLLQSRDYYALAVTIAELGADGKCFGDANDYFECVDSKAKYEIRWNHVRTNLGHHITHLLQEIIQGSPNVRIESGKALREYLRA